MSAISLHDKIKSTTLVKLDKKKSDEYCKKLFESLTTEYSFRNNKYTYCGSYDLSQWLILTFDSMVRNDEKFFSEIVFPLVAYISIVDDACDENIKDFSIEEMGKHCDIFKGENVTDTNPAIVMGKKLYQILSEDTKYNVIKEKVLEFLSTGKRLIEKAKNGCEKEGNVTVETLQEFLIERRIDSMASIFFTINNLYRGLPENESCPIVSEYSELAADVISLINDVASLAKDSGKVVNNYVILNHGHGNNVPISALVSLPTNSFEKSLMSVLKLALEKLSQMETIKNANQDKHSQFESIDEVMKGYCSWCFISKRFKGENHILPDYIPTKSVLKSTIESVVLTIPFLRPWKENDMDKYLDDIENSKKKTEHPFLFNPLTWNVLLNFSLFM